MIPDIERPVLYNYFKDSSSVLTSHYIRSRNQSASDNQGENREVFCRDFLQRVLPPRLAVHPGGEMIDSQRNRTGQLDVVIARDDAPVLSFGGSRDTYLAEGVFCVIEVKSNLTREKLQEAIGSMKRVNSLQVTVPMISIGDGLDRPLRIIFAYEGATLETLRDELLKPEQSDVTDLVCVLDRGALIVKGLKLRWNSEDQWGVFPGKVTALSWLYYHLASFSSGFLGRTWNLDPYFLPFNNWGDS